MSFKNQEELLEFFYGLPVDLQEIYSEVYDMTGRPNVENPKRNIIVSLIDKNQDNITDFVKDVKLFYPDMADSDISLYYEIYICGIKKLRDQLMKDSKKRFF